MTIDAASGANPYASLIANSDALTQTESAKNAGKSDTSAKAVDKTAEDKDTFLKLLVAQLRYQDPSKPVDSTQFIAQTAQFSSLEAMQDMAKSYTQMLSAQDKLQASALIGQTVSYTGTDGTTVTGVVRSASFTTSSVGGTGGEPVLDVNGTKVVLSKVTAFGDTSTTSTTTPVTTTAPATASTTAPATTPATESSTPATDAATESPTPAAGTSDTTEPDPSAASA
ncbi:flagellar hook capping FlgD N-terminal domain-containing protein [Kineococcus arenarius]|uniref:flagellar hook capping FlgD N-terminal domain-containing protein n=1 Tax=Kineococcus sp. SYSU DK007 TaxID=3383128 RepID=UPI003D7D0329